MKKFMKILMIATLIVVNIFANQQTNIKADETTTLDLLIANKKEEENLKIALESLQEELELQQTDEVEVIKLSFIEKDTVQNEEKYIDIIKNNIEEINRALQENIIEGARLEKILEEETKLYLAENNLEYIQGSWPLLEYTYISSPFGERIHPITNQPNFHKGIDIPAPEYTDILSSDDGIVIFSGVQNGYGNVVKIKHFDSKITVYAHNTLNIVKEGDVVKRGDIIAKVGSTGNSTGNHVHFETIINDENIDPLEVVYKSEE